MRTSILRAFFVGEASASDLAADLVGTRVRRGNDTVEHLMDDDLEEDFRIEPQHLVRLCDAVLNGALEPSELETVAFGIIASDYFEWEYDTPKGDRTAEVLYQWSAPEVNFALRPETVRKFRRQLVTGEELMTRDD